MEATAADPIALRILALSAYCPLAHSASTPPHLLVVRCQTAIALASCTGPAGAHTMLISELVRYLHRACPESWALVLAEVAKHGRAAPQLADGVLVLSVLQTPEGPMPYMKLDVLQLRARAFQAARALGAVAGYAMGGGSGGAHHQQPPAHAPATAHPVFPILPLRDTMSLVQNVMSNLSAVSQSVSVAQAPPDAPETSTPPSSPRAQPLQPPSAPAKSSIKAARDSSASPASELPEPSIGHVQHQAHTVTADVKHPPEGTSIEPPSTGGPTQHQAFASASESNHVIAAGAGPQPHHQQQPSTPAAAANHATAAPATDLTSLPPSKHANLQAVIVGPGPAGPTLQQFSAVRTRTAVMTRRQEPVKVSRLQHNVKHHSHAETDQISSPQASGLPQVQQHSSSTGGAALHQVQQQQSGPHAGGHQVASSSHRPASQALSALAAAAKAAAGGAGVFTPMATEIKVLQASNRAAVGGGVSAAGVVDSVDTTSAAKGQPASGLASCSVPIDPVPATLSARLAESIARAMAGRNSLPFVPPVPAAVAEVWKTGSPAPAPATADKAGSSSVCGDTQITQHVGMETGGQGAADTGATGTAAPAGKQPPVSPSGDPRVGKQGGAQAEAGTAVAPTAAAAAAEVQDTAAQRDQPLASAQSQAQPSKATVTPASAASGAPASHPCARPAAGAGAAAEQPCQVTRHPGDGTISGEHEASSSTAVEAEDEDELLALLIG